VELTAKRRSPQRILRIAKEVLKILNANLLNLQMVLRFLCGLRGEKGFCSRLTDNSVSGTIYPDSEGIKTVPQEKT
jgi:hypothetical protein